jgi:hypothetical protein
MPKKSNGGITIVAVLMILFGLAEIATGFTGSFFGIVSTTTSTVAVYASVAIGVSYIVSGLLILTMKRRALVLAMILLGIDVVGRVVLVLTGFYPTNSFKQGFAIILGTAIVILFAIYVWSQRSKFS